MKISQTIFVSILSILAAASVAACDLCGCYNCPLDVVHEKPFSIYAGVAEQFTHFGTDRMDGVKQPNPAGEYIDSSITQVVIGASFLDNRFGLQVSVPLIYRSFQRQLGFAIDRGHVSGLGDVSVTANVIVFKKKALFHETESSFSKDGKTSASSQRGEPDFSATVNLTTGIKLPTGDTGRLKENFAPDVDGAPDSGIGPHDLTLGTGSVDGIFGVQAEVRYKAVFFQADAQYTVRGYGDYQYGFANDLSWSGAPGVYFIHKGSDSLALQCAVSGETKGCDRFQGAPDPDSGVTELFVGPRIIVSLGRMSGDVGVDLPVILNATSFQTTPDYRIRASFSIRF
jgi:hypothetical protein